MGLVCRAFLEPAMDELWRWLPTVDHLIRVLPEHTRGDEPEHQLIVVEEPSEADWQRFVFYARRVQELDYDLDIDSRGIEGPSVNWESVVEFFPGDRLLPNLRCLRSDQGWMQRFFHLTLHPPLRHLFLEDIYLASQGSLAKALRQCGDTLETLNINTADWEPSPVSDAVSRSISCCQVLVDLHADSLLPETIRHLSQLPTLTSLRFILEKIGEDMNMLSFPALQSLDVGTQKQDPAELVYFLERLGGPILQKLAIRYDAEEDFDVPGVFPRRSRAFPFAVHVEAVLRVSVTFPCLRSISYPFYVDPRLAPSASRFCTASVLRPLLGLPNLESVDLRNIPFHLMSSDIAMFAEHWPALRTLRLGDSVNQAQSAIRVEDLLPLADGCPALSDLGLPLHITKRTTCVALRPPFGKSTSRLKNLHIGGTDIEFSPDAAAFLASVFPEARLFGEGSVYKAVYDLDCTKKTILQVMEAQQAMHNGM
ncbi:hypothetical protein PsYK624_136940 [Phanerochaete sordida]|uniref:F-box domain-containing protein n=1 Tax=Phanerochaete sordida TaxID=48140 RepID=A0A9P3GKB4_9APHY|nr:hypothetical protein PsYK624_136940 [Phanerochaete sordida]